MMDVFTLTGEAMTDRGDFFASMFIVLAAGCLVFYFVMGWSVNVIAGVLRHSHLTWKSGTMLTSPRLSNISCEDKPSTTCCAKICNFLIGQKTIQAP